MVYMTSTENPTNPTNTHFVAYTVEADDDASVYDIIDTAIHSDPPTEVPTIAELRQRLANGLLVFADVAEREPTEDEFHAAVEAAIDRIVEIFTLGNVPAGSES